MKLFTIGFTEKSAEQFFGLLKDNNIEVLVDIRRHPDGQLSGFAKRCDLPFFLRELAGCDYVHLDVLSPTDDILKQYRADKDWATYERRFTVLMDERHVPEVLDHKLFETKRCCLLCSEAKPAKCHRRLIAERLVAIWPDVNVVHLTT